MDCNPLTIAMLIGILAPMLAYIGICVWKHRRNLKEHEARRFVVTSIDDNRYRVTMTYGDAVVDFVGWQDYWYYETTKHRVRNAFKDDLNDALESYLFFNEL